MHVFANVDIDFKFNNLFICLFVWWCLMPLSTIFQVQLWWRSVLIGGGNRRTWRKPPTCHKSLTKFITILYTSPWSRIELTTSVVIGTDCIGSCNSNYSYSPLTICIFIAKCIYFNCFIFQYKQGYNWNIVESGVKHHKTNQPISITLIYFIYVLGCLSLYYY